jgi:membrane-bound lytic murein transglycosylase B
MHRKLGIQGIGAGWRSRLSLLASTLALSSALNGWVSGGTSALGAQSASAASTGAPTTTTTTTTTTATTPSTTTTATKTTAPAAKSPTPTCPAASSVTAQPSTPAAKPTTQQKCLQSTKPRRGRSHSHASTHSHTATGAGGSSGRVSPKAPAPAPTAAGSAKAPVPDAATPSTSGSPTVAAASTASPATNVFSPGLGAASAALSASAQVIGTGDLPPSNLIPIYKAAGRRYNIPWQVLAAINGIETNYGRNLNVSSAGAVGWMQFMPATWSQYAVAVSGQGKPNPYDPRAAIYAAAHLLAANGGARNLRQAIFAYNHASWYVDAVLSRAQQIKDWASNQQPTSSSGYALPLNAAYMRQLGRTDEGVDIETAPDGAGVYSMTAGVVTAVASDPSGFGPNYPVIRVTAGPLAGQYIYYGHVAASLVHVGQRVTAGQPIAVMGHTGDAASLGHGHIEIGFSNAAGNPLNHPGTAASPSGAAMRSVLVEVSGALGIHNA